MESQPVSENTGGFAVLDIDSGEIFAEVYCLDADQFKTAMIGTAKIIDNAVKSRKVPRGPEFYMGYQVALKAVHQHSAMTPTDKWVFGHCLTVMGFGNRIEESQTKMAKTLGISRSTVNRSFQRLIESGFIKQNTRIKDRVVFNVVDSYAVKGKPKLKKTDELIQTALEKTMKKGSLGVILQFPKKGAA